MLTSSSSSLRLESHVLPAYRNSSTTAALLASAGQDAHDVLMNANHLIFHRILFDISSEQIVSISDIRYFSLLSEAHQQSVFQLLMPLPHPPAAPDLSPPPSSSSKRANAQNGLSTTSSFKVLSLEDYALRFIRHNPTTRNFQSLLEIVTGQLNNINRQLLLRKPEGKSGDGSSKGSSVPLDPVLVHNGCQGLLLLMGLFHYFSLYLKEGEWRVHLNITGDWPCSTVFVTNSGYGNIASSSIRHHNLLEYLVDELVQLLLNTQSELQCIQYLVLDLMLILCSSSVYQKQGQYLTMMYLFRRCGMELQHALHHPSVNVIFTECLATKLVRVLVGNAVGVEGNKIKAVGYMKDMAEYWQFYLEEVHKAKEDGSKANNVGLLGSVKSLFSAVWWMAGAASSATTTSAPAAVKANDTQANNKHILDKSKAFAGEYWNERHCQLLLCLLHQRRFPNQSTTYNPFREVFHLLSDPKLTTSMGEAGHGVQGSELEEEDDVEMMNSVRRGSSVGDTPQNCVSVDFAAVLQCFVRRLPDRNYLILLYSFLQMNPKFLFILHRRQCLQDVLLACLQGLYHCIDKAFVEKHPEDFEGVQLSFMYTSLTCIEIFVQEAGILHPLLQHSIAQVQVPWFKEKMQVNHKMELLDVMVLVLLKTMSYGVFTLRDSFISKTIRGILINLLPAAVPGDHNQASKTSPGPHQQYVLLHPFISERVMRTMLLYCKKAVKEYELAMKRLAEVSSNESFVVVQKQSMDWAASNPLAVSRQRSDSQSSLDSSHHSSNSQSTQHRKHFVPPHSLEGLGAVDPEASKQSEDEEVKSEKLILALREGIVTLLEIVSTILRTNILTYIHVLYALILDYENVHKQLNHEFMKGLIEMEGDKAALFRIFILNIAKYYRTMIETSFDSQSNKESAGESLLPQHHTNDPQDDHAVGKYLTAEQAMTFLRQHVKVLLKTQKALANQHQVPISPSWFIFKIFSHPSFHHQLAVEELAALAYDDQIKMDINQKYHYQEAENPDAFFLPFIWKNIMIATPHIAWKTSKLQFSDS